MESTTLVLLPSPLLGQAVWEPVAAELANRGYPVQTVSAPSTPPRTSDDVMHHLLSAIPSDREVILLPHSNAGLYVPALVGQRHVVGAVFVDAGLPPKTDDDDGFVTGAGSAAGRPRTSVLATPPT